MNARMSSSENGAPVMTWFMRITWAGGEAGAPASSRRRLASVIHSSVRNSYGTA